MAARSGLSTTLLLAVASIATALLAMVGEDDSFTALTTVCALAGLIPWALVAGGVPVPSPLFAVLAFVPAAVIVVVDDNPGGLFPIMLLVVWITLTSSHRWLEVATLAGSFACLALLPFEDESPHENGILYFAGGIGISWLAGLLLRRQERLTAELRALHELQVEQRAASERTQIAREVHDVVAHSLTIVMLNLIGARRALATNPERAEEALARAEIVGRDSLDSIRQVMGLLREPGSGRDLPQPGLADVRVLVEGYRAAGLAVEMVGDAAAVAGVDPTTQLVVYRVVQESLANAMQHAPGAASTVELGLHAGRVQVSITNEVPRGRPSSRPDRAGLGIRGMTERARAAGGELEAGPTDTGGWRVVATIPVGGGVVDRDIGTAWVPTAT